MPYINKIIHTYLYFSLLPTRQVRVERVAPLAAHLTPRVLVVDAGGVGVFRCQVSGPQSSGSPHPQHTVTWYKDGHVLSAGGRISISGEAMSCMFDFV